MNSEKKCKSEEALKMINEILKEVVPNKVIEDVTPETSITEELALDSVELMDVLLRIKDKITNDENDVDMERLLKFLFKAGDRESANVQSLCDLINELS